MLIWFRVLKVFSDYFNGLIKHCGARLEKDGLPYMCLAVGPSLN